MRKRTAVAASLLLTATQYCHAHVHTLAEADTIIAILTFIVILLLVLGGFSLYHNKIISQRNEQLRRILKALDDYRAILGDIEHPVEHLEEAVMRKLPKPKVAKKVQMDEGQAFFVKMDARVNKEKPFTDPEFDQQALADFMGVSLETFCQLVPRYTDPDRTKDYINSLRAEYAAKIFMESSDYSIPDMARKCGFKDSASFISTFKFAFGITPTDYLNSMNQMFKKKTQEERNVG
jgi:AraC-like DNA-binding protein